jgi:hypothetical protein
MKIQVLPRNVEKNVQLMFYEISDNLDELVDWTIIVNFSLQISLKFGWKFQVMEKIEICFGSFRWATVATVASEAWQMGLSR